MDLTILEYMPCPKCGVGHVRGPNVYMSDGSRIMWAPLDVWCPCGVCLRFRSSDWTGAPYGWEWVQITKGESFARIIYPEG